MNIFKHKNKCEQKYTSYKNISNKKGKEKSSIKVFRKKNHHKGSLAEATNKNNDSNNDKNIRKISITMMFCFLIPIILIITLGIFSYKLASKAMYSKYEESSMSTVSSMQVSMNMMCSSISSKVIEVMLTDEFNSYYNSNDISSIKASEAASLSGKVNSNLSGVKASVDYISAYYLFAKEGSVLKTNIKSLPIGFYDSYLESEEANKFKDSKVTNAWVGKHILLDTNLGIDEDEYSLSYVQHFTSLKNSGFIIMDVQAAYIKELLSIMEFGGGTIKGLVVDDGVEILYKEEKDNKDNIISNEYKVDSPLLYNQDFFNESIESEGLKYVSIDDEKYLYVYTPVGKTGIMLFALIPETHIIAQIQGIGIVTIIMVIVACVISIGIGLAMAYGISSTLNHFCKHLVQVEQGDLTQVFSTNRKDEFKLLTNGMNNMLSGMRNLLTSVDKFSKKATGSAQDVSMATEDMKDSMCSISKMIDDIAQGVVAQAEDTTQCYESMTRLSCELEEINESTNIMSQKADETVSVIDKGKLIVKELNERTSVSVNNTKKLVLEISTIQGLVEEIGDILKIIQGIAEKTNLLSFNASIEAVRAGSSGRGFLVVAEEVNKLAKQSKEAGGKIKKIVTNITNATCQTVSSAKEMSKYIEEQSEALEDTNNVFGEINEYVIELVAALRKVQENMDNIVKDNKNMVDTIHSISAVSQEITASVEEVDATTLKQVASISSLTEDAENLLKEVKVLEESMGRFKV